MLSFHDVVQKTFADATELVHLKQIVSGSGLCKKSKEIKAGPLISLYQYFFSAEVSTDSNLEDLRKTQRQVKIDADDKWSPFYVANKGHVEYSEAFVKDVPNLAQAKPTDIFLCHGKEDVTRCLQTRECRINDRTRVLALYDLLEYVLHWRSESFYWNLTECVKTKSKYHRCDSGLDKDGDDGSGDEDWHAYYLQDFITLEDRDRIEPVCRTKLEALLVSKEY